MNSARRKALVALSLMGAAAAGAVAWKPTTKLADIRGKVELEAMFPKKFGEWKVDENQPIQLVSPDQAALLKTIYDQTLSRTYVNQQGQRVMLSVAYSGNHSDGTRVHLPEVCYPAQGFQILQSSKTQYTLQGGDVRVRQLVAKQGNRIEPISYWIIVGDTLTLSGTEQKLAQLRHTTRGTIPDAILVRLSTIDRDYDRAYRTHAQFLADLAGSLSANARQRVLGA